MCYVPERSAKITNLRLFQNLNAILDANMVVVCDVGDGLFGAVSRTGLLHLHRLRDAGCDRGAGREPRTPIDRARGRWRVPNDGTGT